MNAAGLWAREAGRMAGVHFPVQPMEHQYLVTEEIPEIAERMKSGQRLPAGIDYEANIYFRQEQNGMLLGTYEPSRRHGKWVARLWISDTSCCSQISNVSVTGWNWLLAVFLHLAVRASKPLSMDLSPLVPMGIP